MMTHLALFLCTFVAMEGVGYLAHKYVMHGWGWFLHRSHHEEHLGALETNDIYLLVLAAVAITLIVVGAGVAAFGIIYVIVHDGMVHRYWPFRPRPRNRYLKRLYQAHLLHHAVKGRRNSVSFGFLYAHRLSRAVFFANPVWNRFADLIETFTWTVQCY